MTSLRIALVTSLFAPVLAHANDGAMAARAVAAQTGSHGAYVRTGSTWHGSGQGGLSGMGREFVDGKGKIIAGQQVWFRAGRLLTNSPHGSVDAPDHLRLAYHGHVPIEHPGNAALAEARDKVATHTALSAAVDTARRTVTDLTRAHEGQLKGTTRWSSDAARIAFHTRLKAAQDEVADAQARLSSHGDANVAKATLVLHPNDLP